MSCGFETTFGSDLVEAFFVTVFAPVNFVDFAAALALGDFAAGFFAFELFLLLAAILHYKELRFIKILRHLFFFQLNYASLTVDVFYETHASAERKIKRCSQRFILNILFMSLQRFLQSCCCINMQTNSIGDV